MSKEVKQFLIKKHIVRLLKDSKTSIDINWWFEKLQAVK